MSAGKSGNQRPRTKEKLLSFSSAGLAGGGSPSWPWAIPRHRAGAVLVKGARHRNLRRPAMGKGNRPAPGALTAVTLPRPRVTESRWGRHKPAPGASAAQEKPGARQRMAPYATSPSNLTGVTSQLTPEKLPPIRTHPAPTDSTRTGPYGSPAKLGRSRARKGRSPLADVPDTLGSHLRSVWAA